MSPALQSTVNALPQVRVPGHIGRISLFIAPLTGIHSLIDALSSNSEYFFYPFILKGLMDKVYIILVHVETSCSNVVWSIDDEKIKVKQ